MSGRFFAVFTLGLMLAFVRPLPAQDLGEAERLCQSGQYPKAEGVLRPIVAAQPENAKANYLLGLALLEQSKVDEAEPKLSKARDLGYAPDQVKTGLGRIYLQRQQYDQALAVLNEAQTANPKNADAYMYRGIARANKNQFNEAVQDLEKAIQINPNNAKAHYYGGLAYNGLKRPDKMVEHFQIFLKLAPDAPEAARVRSLLRNIR